MIVVDTNIIAYVWLPCRETPMAEQLLTLESDWCAPLLWRSEFRNVLVGCVRRGVMTIDSAQRTAEDAEAQMREHEYAVPSDLVLRAATASRCSSYDCEFVVLAQ